MSGARGPLILLADDEEDLRDVMSGDFERNGYRVISVPDGREALRALEGEPRIELVLSDVHMPKLGGLGLLAEIRERSNTLPVILFSGHGGEGDLTFEEAFAQGADSLFAKPYDRKELFGFIARALRPAPERLRPEEESHPVSAPGLLFRDGKLRQPAAPVSLGRGGMFVALEAKLPEVAETVAFNLALPAPPGFGLRGSGTVRWVRHEAKSGLPAGCGISFESLAPASLEGLLADVSRRQEKAFIPRR